MGAHGRECVSSQPPWAQYSRAWMHTDRLLLHSGGPLIKSFSALTGQKWAALSWRKTNDERGETPFPQFWQSCKDWGRYTEKQKEPVGNLKSTRKCQWLTFKFKWAPTPRLREPRKNKPIYWHGDKKIRNKYWGKQQAALTHQQLINPFYQLSQTWLQAQWRKKPTPLRGDRASAFSARNFKCYKQMFYKTDSPMSDNSL